MPDDPRTSEIGNTRAVSIRRPENRSEDENVTSHFRSSLSCGSLSCYTYSLASIEQFSPKIITASFFSIL